MPAEQQVLERGRSTSVMIVADGSPDGPAQTVDVMIGMLKTELGKEVALQVARFDVEPLREGTKTGDQDLGSILPVPVRTPMRDTVAVALKRLAADPTPRRAVIVIAAEEFYGSSLSRRRLIDAAREQEFPIYSVVVSRPESEQPQAFFKRVARTLSNIGVWLVEAMIQEDASPSARESLRLLNDLAKATGGSTCSATDEKSGLACVKAIAGEIRGLR